MFKYIVLFIFLNVVVYSQNYPDSQVDKMLNDGISKILVQDYQSAKISFYNLSQKYSYLPLGKIYLAAVEMTKSEDYGIRCNTGYVLGNLQEAEKIANALIEKNPNEVWYRYFLALTEGYKAYFYALNNNYFKAFTVGLSCVNDYKECIAKNPCFYEAYISLGSYQYWKSRKASWLPFVNNESSEGIGNLKKALQHFTYNYHLAAYSLMWIYIDKKDMSSAIKLGESSSYKYPTSRFFKWGLARAYQDINTEKSISIYWDILNSYNYSATNNNHLNEIVIKHKIAQLYEKIGKKAEAVKLCNEILSYSGSLDSWVKDKLEDRIERAKELKEKL